MLLRSFAVLAAVTVAGCVVPPRSGEDAPTLARKVVTQKLFPDTLGASDGTRCATTSGKLRDATIRSDAWCIGLVPPRAGTGNRA